jgi:putative membrane protein
LLVLGAYDHVLTALVELELVTILVFVSGCVIGLLSFSRLLYWTLQRYRQLSYAFLTGMLLGSIYALWPWRQVLTYYTDRDGELHALEAVNVLPGGYESLTGQDPRYLLVLICFLVGVTMILGFEKLFRRSADFR